MSPEFLALLDDLRGKDLLTEDAFQKIRYMSNDGDGARIRLLGYIDASVARNEITAEQAQPYLDRIGISKEKIDRMREYNIAFLTHQSKLN